MAAPPLRVNRRHLLGVMAGAAVAAVVSRVAGNGRADAANTATIYALDPEWGAGDPACPDPHAGSSSCHACRACHEHAAHRLWTSSTLADGDRAHPRCKCLVIARTVTKTEYMVIFGPPTGPFHRDVFDSRRDRLYLPPVPV